MRKVGNLYLPDDKGYDPKEHEGYSWNQVRKVAGLPVEEGANVNVLGFYIRDNRPNPPVAICKNCSFPIITDEEAKKTGYNRPVMPEPPVFFQYAGEAVSFIKHMHLSSDDEQKMTIVALVPAPDSLTDAMPTHIFMDKDAIKER